MFKPTAKFLGQVGRRKEFFIDGLIHKQLSNDSRAFPHGNQLLHAFVRSLPLILASYNRLVVTFLSYFNNVHNSMIAVQSVYIIPQKNFDSEPMVRCIQG